MRDRFAVLATDWRKRGYELGLGIGIAAGYATVGRIGFEGRTKIARSDFGLTFNATLETGGVLVSADVTLEFEISAIKNA